MTREGRRPIVPVLVVGAVCCTMAQGIFWMELVGEGVLLYPFVWAYLQYSMVSLATETPQVLVEVAFVWVAGYVGLALVLLAITSRWRSERRWRVALCGWVGIQAGVVVIGMALLWAGIIEME